MKSGPHPSATELTSLSLLEASELVRSKAVSPVELASACLRRIEELNPKLNAFIAVTGDIALEESRRAEAEIQRGNWRGALHGIPIALKDLIDTAGVKTTAASAVFRDRVPAQDAEIVRRLRAAGAVFLGKLNLHEFAFGGSGTISYFGAVRNPGDARFITGGSSSGSAAAVAAGMCYAAIGTDTAGSIRLPAALCGIVGLKPTYGLVSARGVIPLSWSYDHVGPLTRTVADAAAVLQVIAGYDPEDAASINVAVPEYADAISAPTERLQVGIPREFFYDDLDPEVGAQVEKAIDVVVGLVRDIRDVSIPVDNDRTVANAEDWAYHREYVAKCADLYQPETLRRIRAGAEVTTSAYIDKKRELESLRRTAQNIFTEVDVLITPTVAILAPSFEELEREPDKLRPRELALLRNTRPFNVLGLPTISVPCGLSADGRFVGLQISGAPAAESTVVALARAYEQTASSAKA